MASHQQGEIEGKRKETQAHSLWTLHYFGEKSAPMLFYLDIPTYMHIYLVVNVENLKLFEPPMIMDQDIRKFQYLQLMIFLPSTWMS